VDLQRTAVRTTLLLIGSALCLSGCATQPQTPDRELASSLVKVAVSESSFLKRFAAVKQLRQMTEGRTLDSAIVMPLAGPPQASSPFDTAMDWDVARVLAVGGPRTEQLILHRFKAGEDRAAVLALMVQPSPEVTRALVEMADSAQEPAAGRRLCRLILAARGERSRDWMALVVADVRAEPAGYGEEYHFYESFIDDLGCAAGKLPRMSALPEAVFQRVLHYNGKPTEGAALDALISLAACGADVRSVTDSEQFRNWLAEQPADGTPGGFMPHLTRACLGIDTKAEMDKALAQLGAHGVNSDKVPYCFAFLATWLAGKEMQAAIQRGLSSPDAAVRRGALLLLTALGPDARESLPEVRKSLSDDNAEFRDLAGEMFKYVAGLDAAGHWRVETNPEFEHLMSAGPEK